MKLITILAIITSVFGFQSTRPMMSSRLQMSATDKPSLLKVAGVALIGSSLLATPVLAKEGTGAKFSFFGEASSSPFTLSENREDPLYSPYSPYGDGTAAVYNARKNGKDEISFYSKKLEESIKRVDKVPSYASKKTWFEITTELTRYTYDMRESMLRLAGVAKDSKAANAAAKTYFADLNDMFEWASKKDGDKVLAAYKKSQSDMTAFKALVK